MAEGLLHDQSSNIKTEEVPTAVETQDRGLLDFMGKKEHKPQEEAIATEFDKVHVSEPEHKKEEEEKKSSLIKKLHRSDSTSSSSSSDEEEIGEGGEKKKKKKGLKEKIKDKISGDRKEDEKKVEKHDEVDTSVPVEKVDEPSHAEPTNPEEKKHFLDKIKEKLPGQQKKTDDVPPPPPPPAATECHSPDGEGNEKKGFLEKIKEKLPGYHPKNEEEKQKEKETASH